MAKTIVVAGGTGNLGGRIIHALLAKDAQVVAPVRASSDASKVESLRNAGVMVVEVDMYSESDLAKACKGASCVVSALQGLKEVIIDAQTVLLNAALAAGVPRFIPSDFSVDFTAIADENRNFDLRRQFHLTLDGSGIAPTSIYNGAFAEILGYGTPLLDFKKSTVGYWGDKKDWKLDFTTMDDTAAFTAAAAMDDSTPRSLHIASFLLSPGEMSAVAGELAGKEFPLVAMGSLEDFAAYNKQQREENPESERELYPRWQSGQYMHDQFSTHHPKLDNGLYPDLKWTDAKSFIGGLLKRNSG